MSVSSAYAHGGKTDANGGHRDNKNVSGLGPYHYHCGGYPAHLHIGGVCPYKSSISAPSESVYTYKPAIISEPEPKPEPIQNKYITYTDARAYINGYPIQTYEYENEIYVVCNDLNSYGFKASYSSDEAGSRVDIDKSTGPITPKEVIDYPDGKIAYVSIPTSIEVICGLNSADCVNGDGIMFIKFNELSALGHVHYNEPENKYLYTDSDSTILSSEYTITY